jgi:alcohol dehydrogenase (NADP+)
MKIKGYAAQSADVPLAPFEFDRRNPGDRDVQIGIDFCGICHSDIHFARNEWQMTVYPCVPGHEIVGRVQKVGKDVSKFKEGDRVGVGCLVGSCGTCRSCKEDLENYCEQGFTMTYGTPEADGKGHTFGGYSSQIVVDEKFVLKIPQGLDPASAAPLLCAGITTYSPMRHVDLKKGDRIGIMGLGGLGHVAVKLAASFGAEVTVLSRSPQKEADARRLGAHEFALTRNAADFEKLANRFDYIMDTVSAKHDIASAVNCLKRDGVLLMVGASPEPLDLSLFPLIMGRRSILGSLIGGLKETQEMLDHCGKHNIVSDIEMITPNRINEAFERTLKADVKYRFVIDCSKF